MLILFNKTSISILEKCHSASKDPKNGKKEKKYANKNEIIIQIIEMRN